MSAASPGHRGASGRLGPALALLAALLAGGCGAPVGQVSGRVTFQGQPVPNAELVFTLDKQPADVFYAVSREDGRYVVDRGEKRGLPPGKYQVAVTDYVQANGAPLPGGEEGAVLRNSGQAVQQTHSLTKDVAAGKNEIEIKLEEAQLVPAQK
jgi:hypothetical protein